MTREEAVNELNNRIKVAEYVNSDYIDCVSVDAVKMAISALSVPDTNVGDMISRQAAIDEIEEYADRLQMVNWKENPGVPYKAYALNWCINTIRDLPSAQRTGRWIVVDEQEPRRYGCSECKRLVWQIENYCPNCGARMGVE